MANGDLLWCYSKAVTLFEKLITEADASSNEGNATDGRTLALEVIRFIEKLPGQGN